MKSKTLKNITIILNILLILLFFGYFIGHGLPKSLILWTSASLWLLAPLVNLYNILKNQSQIK